MGESNFVWKPNWCKKPNLRTFQKHGKLLKIKGLRYNSDNCHAFGVIITGCFDDTQRNCCHKVKSDTIETGENALADHHAGYLADQQAMI